MRIARFSHAGDVSYGLVLARGDDSPEPPAVLGAGGQPGHGGDQLMLAQIAGHPFGGKAEDIKLTGLRLIVIGFAKSRNSSHNALSLIDSCSITRPKVCASSGLNIGGAG